MSYSYFPGCSLHSTGTEYNLSTRAVFEHLGLELNELPDWNCCGASSAHVLDHTLAVALPARNLALAQTAGQTLVAPCAACFNRMKNADYILRHDPEMRAEIEALVGFKYRGEIAIQPVLQVIHDYGLDRLAGQTCHPLAGLKVVTYYGCLLVRPPEITRFDDPDDPKFMAELLRAVGAEVKPYAYATECCGGSLSLSRSDLVQDFVGKLVARAYEAGAQAMVTACPLCQVNLEMRQTEDPRMPIFYFTELLGLAFGLPKVDRWWKKHLVDPCQVLHQAGLS